MINNNSQTKVLLTGSDGFVGRHVVDELMKDCLVKKMVFKDAKEDQIACNLSLEPTPELIQEIGEIDAVIHLAALTPKTKEDNSLEKAGDFYINNVVGTLNLLKMIKGKNIKHLTCISTLDVYGLGHDKIDEETKVNPETYYAASKLAAEEACRIFCAAEAIPLAVLRLGHVYGPGEGSYKKVIPVFLNKAINGEPLVIFGKGKALRNFIYVGDVARAIAFVAGEKAEGIFNIVSSDSITILALAELVNSLAGSTKGIEFQQEDFKEIDFIFSDKKLRSLGFKSEMSLKDGLMAEINFLKQ